VVPQGTFRQLAFDDMVHVGEEKVKVPKGTYVQILNWTRHRNPDLWGDTVLDFNPEREFSDAELWHGKGLAAYNPHSERFSPFTHPPRDCIGKNFAQMEARTILLHILRKYSFELAEPYKTWVREHPEEVPRYLGVNLGTMGPRDLTRPALVKYFDGYEKPPLGMHCHIVPRRK
jgi:cytochrome P450